MMPLSYLPIVPLLHSPQAHEYPGSFLVMKEGVGLVHEWMRVSVARPACMKATAYTHCKILEG